MGHLHGAFAWSICMGHLHGAFAWGICMGHLHVAFAQKSLDDDYIMIRQGSTFWMPARLSLLSFAFRSHGQSLNSTACAGLVNTRVK